MKYFDFFKEWKENPLASAENGVKQVWSLGSIKSWDLWGLSGNKS
jgi:hypothetical protein